MQRFLLLLIVISSLLSWRMFATSLFCWSSQFSRGATTAFLLLPVKKLRTTFLPPHTSLGTKRLYGGAAADNIQQQSMTTTTKLIDVDCNLWHKDLSSLVLHDGDDNNEGSFFAILRQDDTTNIRALLAPSSTILEAQQGLQALNHASDQQRPPDIAIRTTVGVHPYHVNDDDNDDEHMAMKSIHTLIKNNKDWVAAVGECGLDASEGFPPLQDQLPWFQAQIALARDLDLPLFVHERLAFAPTMDLLENVNVPIIIHCFTGTVAECQAYINRGYYISLSGYIFKEEAQPVRDCLEQGIIPLDKLMIETDAPYMGFPGCRDAFLAKNADYIANNLNAKKRKRLSSSQYPNAPSSLYRIFDKVLFHINKGRQTRQEDVLMASQLAEIINQKAMEFFQFEKCVAATASAEEKR